MTRSADLAAAKTGRLSIARALPEDAEAWDEFVEGQSEARFCHLWGFRQVLERAYGYRCVYLNILREGRQVGVFPCVAVTTMGGRRLVSQPFNEYGGPLTQDLSTEEHGQLAEILLGVAHEENCQSIEIRGGIGCEPPIDSGSWIKKPLHSYALLNLEDPERLWNNSLTYEARKAVNHARKSELSVEIHRGSAAVGDPFYDLYLISMKRLGVPPHPARFFAELVGGFGDRLVAASVKLQQRPVAILLGIVTRWRLQIWVTASDPRCWSMRPNDLAHWELISWAFEGGLRVFDFGSARYSGQIHFKKKWGASFHDYSWYLIAPPDLVPSMRKQGMMIQTSSAFMASMATLWRWMVPVRLTPILGRPIRKYLTK